MSRRQEPDDAHDRGLAHDLATLVRRRMVLPQPLLDRRGMLGLLGGVSLLGLVGCSSDAKPSASSSSAVSSSAPASPAGSSSAAGASSAASATASGSCAQIPEETGGPFPGDGTDGPNVLAQSGIVRSDITTSFGSASGAARGVPLTVNLTVLDSSKSCAPLAGGAIYLWHCNIDGSYSLYSQDVRGENYLRGVQATSSSGLATFKSIFPAAYPGRWPHIHFEVFPSLSSATSAGSLLRTSQLALPENACNTVYATDGYGQSVHNMTQTSLATDNVFGDGYESQLATVTGSAGSGLTAALRVTV